MDKKGTIKLADFGASKKIEDLATMGSAGSGAKSIRGTPYWMVFKGVTIKSYEKNLGRTHLFEPF